MRGSDHHPYIRSDSDYLISQDNWATMSTSSFLNAQDTIVIFYSKSQLPLHLCIPQIILEIHLEFPLTCLHLAILLVH